MFDHKKSDPALSIGVFDSGVGGLTVLKALVNVLPAERYIYLGDTARVPYGNKSASTIRLHARQCVEFLIEQGVKIIVVACNTVSSLAMDSIRSFLDIPVVDMIVPASQAALQATCNGKIGVIGTRATIGENIYARKIREFDESGRVEVYGQICPLFVPLAEEGWTSHPASGLIAREYLQPLVEKGVDTLILGCTHYPLLIPMLKGIMPGVKLIDCGAPAAYLVAEILKDRGCLNKIEESGGLNADFCVTDVSPVFSEIASRFLGADITCVRQVSVDS